MSGRLIGSFPRIRASDCFSLLPLSHMLEQTAACSRPWRAALGIVYPVSRQSSVLFRATAENRVTMIVLAPQALQLFLNAIEREARRQNREALFERLRGRRPRSDARAATAFPLRACPLAASSTSSSRGALSSTLRWP